MKDSLRLALATIVAASLFVASCSRKGDVNVTFRNFETIVDEQQNLVFAFNKDLWADSLLQRWDSTKYIEFSPAVKGAFKWSASSELQFSPSSGFQPGQDYTAKITKRVLSQLKKPGKLGDKTEFKFHTAPLHVTAANLSYVRGAGGNIVSQIDLDFNYPVKITDAAARVRMSSNGNGVPLTAVNGGTGKTVSLQFAPLSAEDKETPVKLEIAKGVPLATGSYKSRADTAFGTLLPSRYGLQATGITSQHTGLQATVNVAFSQPVHDAGLKNFITIEPAVAFDVQTTDGGIIITSDSMKAEQTYQLTVNKGLQGEFGGTLKDDYSEQITFGKLEPAIHFVNQKGMYLSSRGYKNLALNLVSVQAVKVTVVKVYENNLEFLLRRGNSSSYGYDEEGGGGGDSYEYYNTENLGDTVFNQEYKTDKLPGQNNTRVLHLDFQDKIRDRSGVYVISIADKDHYWLQESKILSLSDIGMIVKEERDGLYVFANSIRDATALKGAEVSFISTNNQRMWSGKTDGDGMVHFEDIAKNAPGFHAGLITARKEDEYSFIWLQGSRTETSRFDVGGREPNATGLNAMIYAERNIYRPGETAHVSTVVRTEDWNVPDEIPIKLRLMMPNGKEFGTMRKILNEQGSAETAFPIPPSALTGTYTLEVYSGNDILLNSYSIAVEDFVPDRLKANVKIDKKEYNIGDSVALSIQADNLFGTPAMNRNWEAELNLNKAIFTAKDYDEYNFGIHKELSLSPQLVNGVTDEKGTASATFGVPQNAAEGGMLTGKIMATVFDETGRPVHRYENLTVYTQPVFIGVKESYDYVGTRTLVKMPLAAVSKDGKPASGIRTHVTVIKKEWHTVIEQSGDHYRYVSQEQEKMMEEKDITINGAGTYYAYSPQLSGDYEVRFALPNSSAYVSKTFYAWGSGATQYSSFEVNNEGQVDIKLDKDKYNKGDNVKMLFTTPFEGRMLVTIERDKVMKHYYLTTENKSASLTIKGNDELVPNAYVSATLFRPMDGAEMPLTVAHGFRNISVESTGDKLPVEISVAEKSRSKMKQTISLHTAPNAFVTIAAVDEGILQVKNYVTPDPFTYFYQKVALSVGSYDIYPLLLPEIKTTRSSTGGDGGPGADAMRVNPLFVNRIKNVSFWSGILQADGSGNVRYTIDVPQFSGDIRVMAAAYKGRVFGSADKHMKVADPVVISAALPRVLSPKDEVVMPVTLSNTTAKDAPATITVAVSGPLGVIGVSRQQVSIPANREARAVFNISAAQAIGAGKITVSVAAMGETFTNETDIAIRPPASLQKRTGSGSVAAGSTAGINAVSSFIASSAKGKLVLGKSPLVQFTKNMEYLVKYPYGCVEQTVSSAFPQLYYADLVKSVSGASEGDPNPAYNVQAAISKLQSMQLSNGALTYWPGTGGESWWGSVYAAHFLLEAKKAGYEVNATTLNHLLGYMKTRLQKRETEVLYYNQSLSREIAAKEVAYSLYVLALAGEPQTATMNYYKGNPRFLAIDSRYLLASAYTISGQPQQARQIIPASFSGEQSNQAFGGSFYSYTRDLGLSLNALLDMDPNNQQVGQLARMLSQNLQTQAYLNTQENVWGMLALGKFTRINNRTNATATVLANSKTIGTTTGDTRTIDLKPYLNNTLQVSVKGAGQYYYFWEASGITTDGSYKEEDSYLKVRRAYYSRDGKPLTGTAFRQNDLVVVKLSLQAAWSGEVENVVVTDMLPAGFEIENTRLADMPEMKWIKSESTPDYLDYRDDRVNIFTSASGTQRDFYYMVRAVSPGTYQLGPVQADAMYNGVFHSYWGAGVVRVEQ